LQAGQQAPGFSLQNSSNFWAGVPPEFELPLPLLFPPLPPEPPVPPPELGAGAPPDGGWLEAGGAL
jgi:hypothetical protein